MSNEAIVREFCAQFEEPDPDALLGYFAPDATYHNMPIEPAVGHEAIRGIIEMFLGLASAIEFEILHLTVDGDLVYTERVDHFTMRDGSQLSLPVMGIFEIADEKIAAWRDYFDLQTFMTSAGMGGGAD